MQAFDDRSHRAFVERLAVLDESTQDWQMASAGFLALRLVDSWFLAAEPKTRAMPRRQISGVRSAIVRAPKGALREALRNLLTATMETWGTLSHRVIISVFAYGQLLQQDEQYALAVDAYNTFLAYAGTGERELMADGFYRLGFCLRMSGQLESAPIAYEIAYTTARDARDLRVRFHSRFGLAAVCIQRGAFVDAEVLMHTVEQELAELPAGQEDPLLSDLRAQAKHERGRIAYHRHRHEDAALLYNEALALYQDLDRRERLLLDIALNFADLGAREAARDTLLINYVSTTTLHVRWWTTINLLQLAAVDGQEVAFEFYRRELINVVLGPFEQAHFQLYVAEGCFQFGRVGQAKAACQKALDISAAHGVDDVRAQAEALRQRLNKGGAPTAPPPIRPVPDRLASLVHTIRELRISAETTG